ncbi:MAG: TRAP transporter substrate-binding protein [Calothrix sp. MO_167.B12]|nr:TRAP transporter substrate-binding protein [Calothrix sp. MO_167.B12]
MKRREIIHKSAIATAAAATTVACTRRTTAPNVRTGLPTVRWRMATSWPTSLGIFTGPEDIAKRVKEMTGGRFTIKPYAGGELTPALQVLDAVRQGKVQCGHTASYYYIGKSPALAFATSVPFGLSAQQQNAWLYHGGGLELIQKLYGEKFNIINFPAGNTGTQMGGWFKREINSVGDLRGLKMRIPGLGGQVMSRLGVNVQVLPASDIYLSLERGAIDAAEWVGPYDDQKLGLNRAAPFYYYPGWWEGGPTLDALVNRQAWEKLPKEYQEIFKAAAYEANINMLSKYDALNSEALAKIVAGGTKLTAYSQDIMRAGQKATLEIFAENASKDATFKQIYEQWKGFREKVYKWNRVNELSFANFVTTDLA